jgi:hypothetical protein
LKIRSITVFADPGSPPDAAQLSELGSFAREARSAYEATAIEVQTARLALPALPPQADPVAYAVDLEGAAQAEGFEYISLGVLDVDQLPRLPEILAATEGVFASAHLLSEGDETIDGNAVRAAASVIRRAAAIAEGFGNLRFAALAAVPAGTPFFPAAYHEAGQPPAFALATQSADLAVDATADAATAEEAAQRLTDAVEGWAGRLVAVAGELARAHPLRFGGIDFSLAPYPDPDVSVGAALEALSEAPLGSPGTLAAAATLTHAVAQANFPRAGFCGLMLPVLEDPVLGRRSAEGALRLGELLGWSAVCGTGLDTVPLPGDAGVRALERVLFDVAALSLRLHKPLTARLMPLPGKGAGDPVHFDFAYFVDGGVLALDGATGTGLFHATDRLRLATLRRYNV